MGHAGRQASDGLQLFGAFQLVLKMFALIDIPGNSLCAQKRTGIRLRLAVNAFRRHTEVAFFAIIRFRSRREQQAHFQIVCGSHAGAAFIETIIGGRFIFRTHKIEDVSTD